MTELPTLPFPSVDTLSQSPMLLKLQAEAPIHRVRTSVGHEAWLVTRYDEIKALFGDPRLGRSHPNPGEAARVSESVLLGGPAGNYETEDVDHARVRSLLVPRFSARRIRLLTPKVEEMVDNLLTDLLAGGRPADFHEALSFRLPVLVVCELLGVPFADRDYFRTLSTGMAMLHDHEQSIRSSQEMFEYMRGLVQRRRVEPGNDMLTELTQVEGGSLSDDEITGYGVIVLFAGHETTVVRIDLGTLMFLANPDQIELLRGDPSLLPGAVEEVLRLAVGHNESGLPRYARCDFEFGGVTIKAGEAVLLSMGAANNDGGAFPDPQRFDITRDAAIPHMTFGHGARYCIGAALARLEIGAVIGKLFDRIPTLRLAVPMDDLEWRTDVLTGGFRTIPITW